jgi:hypothetical protein
MAVLALRLALLKEHSPHLWGEVGTSVSSDHQAFSLSNHIAYKT